MIGAHVLTAIFCAIPLVVAGIVHMAVVRLDLFARLRRPISHRLFGANKTWRGIVVMPIAAILGVLLAREIEGRIHFELLASMHASPAIALGGLLGLAYVVAELPNSYLKRRLGIAPGLLPDRWRVAFVLLDQADSAIGCMLVYAVLVRPPLATLAVACLLGPLVHLLVNVNLYLVGLRKRPV